MPPGESAIGSARTHRPPALRDIDPEFRVWITPHWRAMYLLAERIAGASERDDVLQEALLLAWQRADQYRPGRGSRRNWLLAIVANQARKALRGRRLTEQLADDEVTTDAAVDVDLERAVAALPERQRLAVTLHYYIGLPVTEVAGVMACSAGTVKSTLFAARLALRRSLGEET